MPRAAFHDGQVLVGGQVFEHVDTAPEPTDF
jgi:hypothetical protein